jgi:glucosamine kinase
MSLFMGFDCGGSTTRVRVCDEESSVVFEGRGGPANWAATPKADISASWRQALEGAPRVSGVALCMAGVLTETDRQGASAMLSSLVEAPVTTVPDFYATVAADEAADIVVIAGTGAVVASLAKDGAVHRSGGGGYLLADEGSAASIGRTALKAWLVPAEKPPVSERFREACHDTFGASEGNELLAAIYRTPHPAAAMACLAPAVVLDWVQGETYAKPCVEGPVESLAQEIRAHRRVYLPGSDSATVGLAGGLWSIHPQLTTFVEQRLVGDGLKVRRSHGDPLEGAVTLARRYYGN